MILSLAAPAMVAPCRRLRRPVCFASGVNTDKLRTELDQLHSEAETTRAKANSARLRLLRLSEAAEKLRRQAAINVQKGKENDARDLLFQKKKVMEALEKSKNRIEVLDELSAKLNQAITVKETQLIGNISLDLEVDREDGSTSVHIVSPKKEATEVLSENNIDLDPNASNHSNDQDLQFCTETQENIHNNNEIEDNQGYLNLDIWNKDDTVSTLRAVTSYEDFLKHLDQQLNQIEAELVNILRVSTLVLDSFEKPKNSKIQQTMELLESVRSIRHRIANFMQEKVEIQ